MTVPVYENTWHQITSDNVIVFSTEGRLSMRHGTKARPFQGTATSHIIFVMLLVVRTRRTKIPWPLTKWEWPPQVRQLAEIIQVSGRKFNFLRPPAGLVVLLPSWPTVFLIANWFHSARQLSMILHILLQGQQWHNGIWGVLKLGQDFNACLV